MIFKIAFLFFLASSAQALPIQTPFVTDGCTGFVNGTCAQPHLWLHCCVEHDLHFWAGGTRAMRDRADLQLQTCVEKTGEKWAADLMYLGVHLGSYSPIKFAHMAWGNAWSSSTVYRKLSPQEVDEIEEDLRTLDLPEDMKQGLRDAVQSN